MFKKNLTYILGTDFTDYTARSFFKTYLNREIRVIRA